VEREACLHLALALIFFLLRVLTIIKSFPVRDFCYGDLKKSLCECGSNIVCFSSNPRGISSLV
jgi:hypothetical protein